MFRLKILSAVALVAATASTAQPSTDLTTSGAEMTEVTFKGVDDSDLGTARLNQTRAGLLIQLDLHDLPEGAWLAFHIHENGVCDAEDGFKSAGGHWNVADTAHGYLAEGGPHSGDMPNQHVGSDGTLVADVLNMQAFLSGETGNVSGLALILHAGPDDYAAQPSGDAGERLACAVIE